MPATTPRPKRKAPRPATSSPKLVMTIHTEAAERFRALPPAERKRRLEAFRETFAPAFASVDEYLEEKRRESRHDA